MEISHAFKVCVVGKSGAGKSCLTRRYVLNDWFGDSTSATVGVEVQTKIVVLDQQACSFAFWDTAGQERFARVTRSYYAGAHALVIVFALNDAESFSAVDRWWQEFVDSRSLADVGAEELPVMLVGTKSDLIDADRPSTLKEQAAQLAESRGWFFFACSAKTGDNVYQSFSEFARHVFESRVNRRQQVLAQVARQLASEGIRIESAVDRAEGMLVITTADATSRPLTVHPTTTTTTNPALSTSKPNTTPPVAQQCCTLS